MRCGKAFELERIKKVPEIPAWWFVGGRAVHAVTEEYDNAPEGFDVAARWIVVFNTEVESQRVRFPDVSKWRTAGRRSKAKPDGEDYLEWMDLGPKFVQNYIDWRVESRWSLADFGSGVSVELALDVDLAGFRVKGSIDRVFLHPNGHDLVICDLKTGSRMPDSDLQLGLYRAAMQKQFGIAPKYGMFYMNRMAKPSQLFDLTSATPVFIGALGKQLKLAVESKVFLPHKSVLCPYCPVNNACHSFGGKDAGLFDSLSPEYTGAK
jgi:putative RecB family exonuclease